MIVTTPARICLFGEHQDYLGLPVIAMAVSVYSRVKGERSKEKKVVIHKPDLNESESFSLNDLTYTKTRDYFKSGIKVCQDEGLLFSSGFEVEVTSNIPIQAGCGSSSAIVVGWIHFLARMADEPPNWDGEKIGELAYRAEVTEFNEPGGMMDQYSSAIGGTIYLESEPTMSIRRLSPKLGAFVLGDSGEPKDTMGILLRCRDNRLTIIEKLKIQNTDFDLYSCDSDFQADRLNDDEKVLLGGTIRNSDLLRNALQELEKDQPDHKLIGQLLSQHHAVLRDVLKVSTSKIKTMLEAALNAGALGGKINGSGGGGCMFVYAPDNFELVAEAIEKAGGEATVIHSAEGTKNVK